ncbi:hypothetical protein PENTCL1PPCAC_28224 [Pristionchus entomophagus]|uniref:acid phosphatase n=1 Tax=Pristionchus entomophagus TaxID=358040 RepID=A0AAV5UG83_9BILA|nr:hypothetical protein PENTCL1PPCAC_28224 [Pristionchus entomophagus]
MNSVLVICLVGVVVATSDELLSVNVVIRHADRSATSGWATPQSPQILFRGSGELTDLGIDNAFAQGKDFRDRYVKSGFIDKRFLPTEVFVRSSAVNRCLMSAASFTNALFKQTPKDHAVVPPIYTKDEANDGLLVPLLTCQDGWEDVVARYNLSSNVDVFHTSIVAMMMTEWPAACATVNPGLVDAIIAELPNKLINMPANYKSCAQGPEYIELLAGAGGHFNALRLKRVAGLLTSELLSNFAAASNCATVPCPGQPKMRIYYTIFQKNGQQADFVDTNNCASDCSLAAVTTAASPLAITSQIPCA